MTKKSLQRCRTAAFARQGGCCYYCGRPIWIDDSTEFAVAHHLTRRQVPGRACTAEHLIARRDGGPDTCENIVAACRECNQTRHRRKEPPSPACWTVIRARWATCLRG